MRVRSAQDGSDQSPLTSHLPLTPVLQVEMICWHSFKTNAQGSLASWMAAATFYDTKFTLYINKSRGGKVILRESQKRKHELLNIRRLIKRHTWLLFTS